jgi:cytoskeleton-associated protein 5
MTWVSSLTLTAACKDELLDLVGPVTACLQDRSGDVRRAAQVLLAAMLEVLSVEAVKRACSEQQPKLLASLTPVLEAARSKKSSEKASGFVSAAATAPLPAAPRTPQRSASMRPTASTSAAGARPTTPLRPSHSLHALLDEPSSSSQPSQSSQQQQPECPIITTDPAAKIARAEKGRWQLDAPRREVVDGLREQMLPHLSSAVVGRLFSEDFREQSGAMARLEDWLGVAVDDLSRARLVANSDLLLKYLALRFSESANTAVFLKALELTGGLISGLDACNYRLTEYEASIFLPVLINKVSWHCGKCA